jgi:LETM1 and EF-hand domain-containing protein 1
MYLATPQLSSIVTARPIAHLQRRSRAFPTHQTALAILIPLNRTYSTGPSTSTSGGAGGDSSFPPPGFDAEKAKKPLPSAESRKPSDQVDSKDGSASSALNKDGAKVAETAASGSQKTAAETEKRALEKAEPKKMTIGQKIKHEIQHYWDGTKLLATEVRISVKLAMKMAAGYELSRRENRQVRYHLYPH